MNACPYSTKYILCHSVERDIIQKLVVYTEDSMDYRKVVGLLPSIFLAFSYSIGQAIWFISGKLG